ncbi:MAG: hypothetical protein ACYSR9_12285 [Planctomycetota bacterium]|jgi:hypothetical protein
MEIEKVAPRIAFTPAGKFHFFDQNGTEIKPAKTKMPKKDFIQTINDKGLQDYGSISFFSLKGQGNECKIVIILPDGTIYCFIVDCTTGAYIRPCP